MTSIFERPAVTRDLPKPAPRPLPADPWFAVKHPIRRGVVTYWRSRDDADEHRGRLLVRYGEHREPGYPGKVLPRVDVVDGLPPVCA